LDEVAKKKIKVRVGEDMAHRYDSEFRKEKIKHKLSKQIDKAIGDAIMTLNINNTLMDKAIKEVEEMIQESKNYWFRID
jgi:hypothetical protein